MQDNEINRTLNEKQLKQIRMESLLEMNKLDKEIKKEKRKKAFKFLCIVLLVVSIIRIFFGTIEIYNLFGYPSSKARFYKVTINDQVKSVNYETKHRFPIVPKLINFSSNYAGSSIIEDNGDDPFIDDGTGKYVLNINSYSCFSKKYQIECKNDKQKMKLNDDTNFSKLKITRTSSENVEVYNGKYVNDITAFVEDSDYYSIEITANHGLTETKVYIDFIK